MDDIKILISALLHDLGKVIERTREYSSRDLPEKFNKVEYAHPKFSAYFLEVLTKEKSKLSNFLKENLTEEVINLTLYHHEPKDEYGNIIQIADWLASSEREESRDQTGYYVNTPLKAPFKKIDENAKDLRYSLSTLENIFPTSEDIKVTEDDYKKLMYSFSKLFPQVNSINQLLTLFEFYFSQVPAQTIGYEPDISIYDHSRITAALAHALYKDYESKLINRDDLIKLKNILRSREEYENTQEEIFNKKLFTLILGDLSGIQSFLFNVSSEKAGKMLKGKSVFIDLLSRYSAKYILDTTGFTRVNTIYLGGGNFELLLSYIPEEKLNIVREYLVENIWKFIGEELYLGIEWDFLSINDLFNFIYKREKLIEKLNERKKRKYSVL
ncbi:MAG: type III-A CRISPR-associated protein Cas10/Csm1, partial [Dictyoglomus sp.]